MKRIVACIAGYQFGHNYKASEPIGSNNAILLIEWLEQCQFEIKDLKPKKKLVKKIKRAKVLPLAKRNVGYIDEG